MSSPRVGTRLAASSLLLALVIAACASPGPKAPPGGIPTGDYSYLKARLAFEAEKALKEHKLASIAIAVVDGSETVFAQAFGFADVDRASPAERNTVYRQGSITKLLTGIAIMQLVEQGKIDLDAPVKTYLPDFSIAPPPQALDFESSWKLEDITVRSVLTHHSGLPGDRYEGLLSRTPYRHDEVLGYLKDESAAAPVGLIHAYSNLGYGLLGQLIEKVSGQPYAKYVKKHILAPSGMRDADFERTRPIKARLAQPHKQRHTVELPEIGNLSAGGLYASLDEMASFARMLLAKGMGDGGEVIPAARLEEMWQRQNEKVALDFSLEQGLTFIRDFPHVEGAAFSVGHNGATAYQRSTLSLLPDEGLAVVVLTNSYEGGPAIGELAELALAIALETKTGKKAAGAPASASESKNVDEDTAQKLVGAWDTPLGAMFVTQKGKDVMAKALGQTFELRATERDTLRLYLKVLGFVPFLPDELARLELRTDVVDGRDVLVVAGAHGDMLFGTRLKPEALGDAWKARAGHYEYVSLDEDPLFPKVELAEIDGFLCFRATVKDAPGQLMVLALHQEDDNRAVVAGLGRNRGNLLRVLENGDIAFAGYRLRKKAG